VSAGRWWADIKRRGEAVLLDEWIRANSYFGRDQLRSNLHHLRGLNDVGGRSQTDRAMPFAVITTGFIYVGSERSAGD